MNGIRIHWFFWWTEMKSSKMKENLMAKLLWAYQSFAVLCDDDIVRSAIRILSFFVCSVVCLWKSLLLYIYTQLRFANSHNNFFSVFIIFMIFLWKLNVLQNWVQRPFDMLVFFSSVHFLIFFCDMRMELNRNLILIKLFSSLLVEFEN
jgi:hypothetical protein